MQVVVDEHRAILPLERGMPRAGPFGGCEGRAQVQRLCFTRPARRAALLPALHRPDDLDARQHDRPGCARVRRRRPDGVAVRPRARARGELPAADPLPRRRRRLGRPGAAPRRDGLRRPRRRRGAGRARDPLADRHGAGLAHRLCRVRARNCRRVLHAGRRPASFRRPSARASSSRRTRSSASPATRRRSSAPPAAGCSSRGSGRGSRSQSTRRPTSSARASSRSSSCRRCRRRGATSPASCARAGPSSAAASGSGRSSSSSPSSTRSRGRRSSCSARSSPPPRSAARPRGG